MSVAAFAERQSRAAALVAGALLVAGIVSAFLLPSGIYPPLQFPRVIILAHSGTLPSQSMMLSVTRPLEQAVMEVPGIRRVRSTTFRGASEISAVFEPSTDMVVALQQVQNRVADIRNELPLDTDLTIDRLTPAAFPMFIFSLGGNLPTPDLHDYAFYVMRPALARVPGVGKVEVLSSETREIEVVLDPQKLMAANLTVPDVADTLKAQNQLQPVGRFTETGQQHLTLVSGLWTDLTQIASAPVAAKGPATLRVSDVGSVFPGAPDKTLLVTGDGRDAAEVSVSQQIGANILRVKEGLDEALASLSRALPAGLRVTKVYDLAEFVQDSIASVRDAIVIGGLLAIAVLVFFLRDWRLTLIAAMTLPLAVIPTFFFMQVFGGSINLMSMGGLAVAIGLVIDDAVVVVENIHRRAAMGTAVSLAVDELVAPLVSSTLTTVVVFAPLALLSGVPGQFFRALSLTLSVAVLLSLGLSLTVVPLMARRASHREQPRDRSTDRLAGWYERHLANFLRRPALAFGLVVVLALGTVLLFFSVGTGFLPPADEGGFVIDYVTPAGSALEETDQQVRRVESILSHMPEVASYSRRTGSELGMFATHLNKGDILVRLKPRSQRRKSSEALIAELRPRVQEAMPLAEIEFVQLLQDMLGDLEGNPTPIEVRIFGDDPSVLERTAEPVEKMLAALPGVVDVVGVQHGNPELTWTVDPGEAARLGVTSQEVADQLAANWLGEVSTDLRSNDRLIPVRVRLPDDVRFDPAKQPDTLVRTGSGALVPLRSIARPTRSNSQADLMRENLRQMALVTARLEERDLGSAVAEIQSRLAGMKLPVGYTYEVGGQYQQQRQAFRELLMVFGIGAVLVFAILVIQFREFVPATLILAAAPLSLGGALLLLVVTGAELDVSSAMGLILLVGLVVKNGIMLLDFIHRRLDAGEPLLEAVAHAGRVRLRPILMTTLCTLFGLLPLALGLGPGAELQKPLALAVIGGLAVSTLVTLFAVPSLYAAVRRLSGRAL